MATLQIRPDIREQYAPLFGPKTVNGRTLVVEDVIARPDAAVSGELPQLLAERLAFQDKVGDEDGARYEFLPACEEVERRRRQPDDGRGIRRGMLDGFFGRRRPTRGG